MENNKQEQIKDIAYDFMLCAIFGAGVTLWGVVVISLYKFIWNQ